MEGLGELLIKDSNITMLSNIPRLTSYMIPAFQACDTDRQSFSGSAFLLAIAQGADED